MKNLTDGAIAKALGWAGNDDEALASLMAAHEREPGEQLISDVRDAIEADRKLNASSPYIALVEQIARLKTESEYGDEGMSGDDAVATLSELIQHARQVLQAPAAFLTPEAVAAHVATQHLMQNVAFVPAAIRLFDGDLDYRSDAERVEKARMLLAKDDNMSVWPDEEGGWFASINDDDYHGYDEADAVLKCQAAFAERYRLAQAVDRAKDGFWVGLVQSYPEITTGDLDPHAELQFDQAAHVVGAKWYQANKPAVVSDKTVDNSTDLSM